MPTRAEVEAALKRLPKEKHKAFLAAVRRRMEAQKDLPQMKPQQERGIVDKARDWLTGAASDMRIRDEERAGLREAGVGLHPTTREEAGMAMLPVMGMMAPEVLAAPAAAVLGTGGAMAGGELAARGGERVGPGVGELARPVGALVGGGVGAAAPSVARGAVSGAARAMPEVARATAQGGRAAAGAARKGAGPAAEMVGEGLLDTALGVIPGGGLVSGVFRRLVARPIMRSVLKLGERKVQNLTTLRGRSANVGTTRPATVPEGGLPAPARSRPTTATRIEKAPKASEMVANRFKKGKAATKTTPAVEAELVNPMGAGSKAQIAWRESVGLRPGAMGPDDVAAMRARGATADEIEAALLRNSRPKSADDVGWTPSPKMGQKPKDWKPPPAPPKKAVQAGLPEELSQNEHQIIMRLQGLAKSQGNKAAIKQAVKETFGDNWKAVWDYIMSPQTRL